MNTAMPVESPAIPEKYTGSAGFLCYCWELWSEGLFRSMLCLVGWKGGWPERKCVPCAVSHSWIRQKERFAAQAGVASEPPERGATKG
eukprot:1680225-Amphidinium_carterae.1